MAPSIILFSSFPSIEITRPNFTPRLSLSPRQCLSHVKLNELAPLLSSSRPKTDNIFSIVHSIICSNGSRPLGIEDIPLFAPVEPHSFLLPLVEVVVPRIQRVVEVLDLPVPIY